MMGWCGRLVLAVWWVQLCAAPPLFAQKARHDPISEKIERERKELEKLKGEIEDKRRRAEEAEKKRESILQGIQTLDERLLRYRHDRQEISQKLKKKDRELDQINDQLTDLRAGIQERQDTILARLRVQYMEGRFGYLKALLSSDSYGDFTRRFQYLSAVSRREYEVMETYKSDVSKIERVERQRAEARAAMIVYKQGTDKKLQDIQGIQKEKKVVLAKITQQKESYDRAVEELERSAARIDGLLRELEQRRRAAAVRPPSASLGPRASK
ncbi:MAG: murein hydrolase activator EnvC family protein, partial [Nitrospiraceae bacterium]